MTPPLPQPVAASDALSKLFDAALADLSVANPAVYPSVLGVILQKAYDVGLADAKPQFTRAQLLDMLEVAGDGLARSIDNISTALAQSPAQQEAELVECGGCPTFGCPVGKCRKAAAAPAAPISITEPGLPRAIERLKAQIQWLRHGKLSDACPMMAVDDMEALLAAPPAAPAAQQAAEPTKLQRFAKEALVWIESSPNADDRAVSLCRDLRDALMWEERAAHPAGEQP